MAMVIYYLKEDNMLEKHRNAINFYINNEEYSITKVAKLFHMDRIQLGRLLKEEGINQDRRRKYFFNENFFKEIDSEDKAYWLGFIMADGCIKDNNEFSFCLKYSDKYILEKFNIALNSNYKIIKELNSSPFGIYESATLTIHSKKFCETLKEYGIIQRKTNCAIFNYNNKIPNKYLNAYIRGLFDGDG